MASERIQRVNTIKATFKRQRQKPTVYDIHYWAQCYLQVKEEELLMLQIVDRYVAYLKFSSEEVYRRCLELHIGTYTVTLLNGSETTVTVTPVEPEEAMWVNILSAVPKKKKVKSVPDCTSQTEETTRSQSTSRVPKSREVADLKDGGARRSASVTRNEIGPNSAKAKSQGAVKKKSRVSDLADVFSKDPFIDYLESIKKEKGIPTMSEEQFWVKQREALQTLLKDGSELKLNKLDRKAVDKYKTALSMILDHSPKAFRLTEIDFIVLKYSLSTCLLELSAYSDIIKAIEYLTEIQTNAKAFPAVYYGLGKAYKQLNRFKTAVEHLEKGSTFLKREVKFETQSWPETNVVIPETTREGLEDLIDNMLRECTAYHEPDAICKYSKCRDISSHILPSEHIFFSDPEFAGYVIVSCEEKCRVEYHLSCWKDYKEKVTDDVGKHNDKVLLGRNCPTADCFSQPNVRSVINKIEIVGEDGSIKSTVEPPKGENTTVVKEKILSKKKKPDVMPQSKTKAPKKPKKPLEVVKPVVIEETPPDNTAKDLEERLEKLDTLRDLNFGSLQESNWDPRKMYFGNLDVQNLDHFLSPEYAEETEKDRMEKEFVFSYIYEYLRQYGPQKMDDVEKKWKAEHNDFNLGKMLSFSENVCPFLLKSYRFAAVEDYISVSEQLPNAYKMAKTASVEAVTDMLTKINNLADSTAVAKERKESFTGELQSLLEEVHETETCNFENSDFRNEIVLQSENQLLPSCGIDEDDLYVAGMIQEEYDDQKESSENTLYATVDPTALTQLTDDEHNTPQAEGHIHFKTSESASPVHLGPDHTSEKLRAVRDVATAIEIIETSHQAIQTEEYIDPELVKYTKKVEELTKAQEEAKKKSDEHTKKEKQQKQVIEKLLQSTAEIEKELNKLKLQKADEATALKETIAQKTKEIETLKKKLSIEKSSCEELKNRISEIICETGKKSDLLKACEEQRSQLRTVVIKAVQERGDIKINSSKQKCHDRLQILRCMLTSAEANTEKKPDILSDIKSWETYLLKVKEYASKFMKLRNELEADVFSTNFEALEDLKFPEEPNCFYSTLEEMIIWITSDDNKQKSEQLSDTAETKRPEQKPSVNNLNSEERPEMNMENYNRNMNQHLNMPPPPLTTSQMYKKYGNLTGPALFQQHMQSVNPMFGAPTQPYYYPSNMNYRTAVPMMNMHPQTPRSHPPAHNSWMHKDNWAPPSKEKQEAESKPKPAAVAQLPKTATPPAVQPNGTLMGSKKENEPPAETKIPFKPPEKIATPPLLPAMSKESGPSVSVPPLKPVNNLQPSTVQKTEMTKAPSTTVTGVPTAPTSNSYGKLMKHLHRHFPARTEEELMECVTIARQRNNNSLSQLKMTTIINMIDKILKEKAAKKQGVAGLEKFGGSAWGEVRTDTVSTWSKSQDEVEECIICTDSLKDNKVQLQCKHTFHSKCIKTWLRTNSVCPICREFTRLVDEYPPLA